MDNNQNVDSLDNSKYTISKINFWYKSNNKNNGEEKTPSRTESYVFFSILFVN
jgi:hypothetical protein